MQPVLESAEQPVVADVLASALAAAALAGSPLTAASDAVEPANKPLCAATSLQMLAQSN